MATRNAADDPLDEVQYADGASLKCSALLLDTGGLIDQHPDRQGAGLSVPVSHGLFVGHRRHGKPSKAS